MNEVTGWTILHGMVWGAGFWISWAVVDVLRYLLTHRPPRVP
jgi:hypothetical protein